MTRTSLLPFGDCGARVMVTWDDLGERCHSFTIPGEFGGEVMARPPYVHATQVAEWADHFKAEIASDIRDAAEDAAERQIDDQAAWDTAEQLRIAA